MYLYFSTIQDTVKPGSWLIFLQKNRAVSTCLLGLTKVIWCAIIWCQSGAKTLVEVCHGRVQLFPGLQKRTGFARKPAQEPAHHRPVRLQRRAPRGVVHQADLG
ncbi:MAG: hypothetical protein UT32_C0002G0082 [Parcubacteria group bacterium GW2011_GWC2_39_14]|nr:MAG: hypothetical protein UT32_C0002G0082 [Parcubacteria group bacterium GW2011_GWC2_39_14]KKR55307.1 MAG: hypothetical protein UT91_C0003G0082 [Parcubacteria group bacterium GW2011_GWA2_40_23]